MLYVGLSYKILIKKTEVTNCGVQVQEPLDTWKALYVSVHISLFGLLFSLVSDAASFSRFSGSFAQGKERLSLFSPSSKEEVYFPSAQR